MKQPVVYTHTHTLQLSSNNNNTVSAHYLNLLLQNVGHDTSDFNCFNGTDCGSESNTKKTILTFIEENECEAANT